MPAAFRCRQAAGGNLAIARSRPGSPAVVLLLLMAAASLACEPRAAPGQAAESAATRAEALPTGALLRIGPPGDASEPDASAPASIRGVALSADGRLLATRDEPGDPGVDRAIRLWDAATGKPLRVLTGHERPIADFAISPDAGTLVSTDYEDGGDQPGLTRLWNTTTGETLKILPEGGPAVEFAPDGATFSLVVRDQLRVYRTATGEEVHRFPGPNVTYDLSSDGRLALARSFQQDAILRLSDVTTGRERAKLEMFAAPPRTAIVSPDARMISAADGASVVLCEVETSAVIYRLNGHARPVFALAFSPDGRFVASGALDRTVRLWEVATGRELHRFEGHGGLVTALAFSREGDRLVSGSTDRTAIVWDLTGRAVGSIAADPIDAKSIEDLWHDLAAPDPGRAYRAIGRLAASRETGLPRLREKLVSLLVPDQNQRIERLLRELAHHDSHVRQRATRELRKLRQIARPLLDRLLAETDSPEVRNRVLRILGGDSASPRFTPGDERRMIRVLAALEQIGGPQAEDAVELIIREFPPERVVREARAMLERMRSS